jgi:hypothetical protein
MKIKNLKTIFLIVFAALFAVYSVSAGETTVKKPAPKVQKTQKAKYTVKKTNPELINNFAGFDNFFASLFRILTFKKSPWRSAEPVMAGLPRDLGKAYKRKDKPTVYTYPERQPTAEEYGFIDEAISFQLKRSTRPNPNFTPADAYLKWKKYARPVDYSVLILDTPDTAESADIAGCSILKTFSGYAAGTVQGIRIVNNKPTSKLPVIIVARIKKADESCKQLFRNAVDYESEHVRTLNEAGIYFAYTGIYDVHPIFPLTEEEKAARARLSKYWNVFFPPARSPDGFTDYAMREKSESFSAQ